MSTDTLAAGPPRAATKPLSQWVLWGRAMVLPYVLVFLVFVLFPVCYGLWLAQGNGKDGDCDREALEQECDEDETVIRVTLTYDVPESAR